MRTSLYLLWLALAVAAPACSSKPSSSSPQPIGEVRSGKPHDANPVVDTATQQMAVAGHNAFAFDLYRQLAISAKGNLVFSPTSIEYALAMTYAGAHGNTAAEMATALHFTADTPPAFNRFATDLASRNIAQSADAGDAPWLELDLVNTAWAQKGYSFVPDYLDVLSVNYDAGVKLLDFQTDPNGATDAINGFVADHTRDRIQNLLPPGALDNLTRLVLTNCVHFWGSWQVPFDANATSSASFHVAAGDIQLPTMHQRTFLGYAEGSDWQATALPYAGGKLSFVIVLPGAGQLDTVRSRLSSDWLDAAVAQMNATPTKLALALPKFRYDFGTVSLKQTLQALGMKDAFVPDVADFSGMEPKKELYIANVFHKAFVQVAEKGTDAAAATSAVVSTRVSGSSVVPKPFIVDRPFMFLIRDDTGLVLFVGEVDVPGG
jgi:serpin B